MVLKLSEIKRDIERRLELFVVREVKHTGMLLKAFPNAKANDIEVKC